MMLLVDALIEYCEVQRRFVDLERTQRRCARAHRCEKPSACPLAGYFRRERREPPRMAALELGFE